MKIKIRPFGWINLGHMILTLGLIVCSVATPIYAFFFATYDVLLYLPVLLVYPLIIHFIQIYNRYIEVDNDKLIFQLDYESGNLFMLPTFYQDEFKLKDLKYYGDFSAHYIKGYQKAVREPKGGRNRNIGKFDILEVKEGKIKIPVGSILFGSPLAFVFNKDQYVLDDYLFTPDQYSALFYVIQQNCGMPPSGGIKAVGTSVDSPRGVTESLLTVIGIVASLFIPFAALFFLQRFTTLPIDFAHLTAAESAFLFMFMFGNLCLLIKLRSREIKYRNFESYDLIEFIATVCMGLAYLVCLASFIFAYFI